MRRRSLPELLDYGTNRRYTEMKHPATPLLFALVFSFVYGTSSAQMSIAPGYPEDVFAYDPREVAMLPPYCKYTALFQTHVPGGDDHAEYQHWYAIFGDTYRSMHHYCWGLMKTNRALLLSRNEQTRKFYLASSIQEFDYVLDRAPKDFVLNPEILTKKGENLLALGKTVNGIEALQRAIDAKADYWPPYATLSDFYRKIGERDKARAILDAGLAASPNVKALKRRREDLERVNPKPGR
jgi:tetratricopeptide (TPR) repeat protein